MQHLFNKQPEYLRTVLLHTTATTEWSVFVTACILEKESEMANLSTDCDAEKFQRKYLLLKAQKQQLQDLLDLFVYFNQERQN